MSPSCADGLTHCARSEICPKEGTDFHSHSANLFFETILKRKSTHTHSHVHMRMLTHSHTRWFTLKAHLYFENIQIEFFHIQFITLITFDHLTCMIFSLRNCVCAALAVNWCFNVAISPHISAHHVRHS